MLPKLGRRRPPGKFDKVVIKVRATCERLRQHAAATRFRVPLVGGEVARRLSDGLADPVVVGDYVVYPRRNGWVFRGVPMNTAIVDTERQCPTYTHTEHLFGEFEDGDDAAALYAKNLRSESPFRGVDRIKLIMSLLTFPRRDGGAGLPLDKLVARGVLAAAFPLHDFDELKFLERKWLVYFAWPWKMPVHRICDYFGEKIGFYFVSQVCVDANHRFGGSPPHFRTPELGRGFEVDSADVWTHRRLSSRFRSAVHTVRAHARERRVAYVESMQVFLGHYTTFFMVAAVVGACVYVDTLLSKELAHRRAAMQVHLFPARARSRGGARPSERRTTGRPRRCEARGPRDRETSPEHASPLP